MSPAPRRRGSCMHPARVWRIMMSGDVAIVCVQCQMKFAGWESLDADGDRRRAAESQRNHRLRHARS